MPDDPLIDQTALVVGESLIDVIVNRAGRLAEHVGGSPMNVAVGLARLGHPVALLTQIGDDARGRRVAEHLRASGVALVPGSVVGRRTSTATAHLDATGAATYDFDLEWTVSTEHVPAAPALVHTGSLGASLPPGADAVLDLLHALAGATLVSFDPNVRPALAGDRASARARAEAFVAQAHVVKASDEDLGWLYAGEDPVASAVRWLDLGADLVIVTRGGDGALALTRRSRADVGPVRVAVADTVGAGDSFMAATLDWLWRHAATRAPAERIAALGDADLADLLDHAATCAAITVSRIGANPPTTAQLAAWRAGRDRTSTEQP